MSYMPNIGAIVRLKDGRIAAVSGVTPLGNDDKVIFEDGHEENVDQLVDIVEVLVEEEVYPHGNLLKYLLKEIKFALVKDCPHSAHGWYTNEKGLVECDECNPKIDYSLISGRCCIGGEGGCPEHTTKPKNRG